MKCPRCDGFMVGDELMDLLDSQEILCDGWRCINCGETVDPIVLENRKNPDRVPTTSKRRWKKVITV